MRFQILATALFLGAVTAGCVSEELSNPAVNIQATAAAVWGDACASDSLMEYRVEADEDCHEVTVHVVNDNEKEDLDTSTWTWSAVSGGAVFDAAETKGPDAIVAGGRAEVVVMFVVGLDSRLDTIRYKDFWMSSPVSAPLPSY